MGSRRAADGEPDHSPPPPTPQSLTTTPKRASQRPMGPSLQITEGTAMRPAEVIAKKDVGECATCDRETNRHCSICGRDWYCSESCQEKMFTSHRFECAAGSLTTADYLFDAMLRDEIPDDPQTVEHFGFDKCTTWHQKSHLLGLYKGLLYLDVEPVELDKWRSGGDLVEKIIETFERVPLHNRGAYFPWFLRHKHLLANEDNIAGLTDSTEEDALRKSIEEVRPLLAPEDRKKEVWLLEPIAKRCGVLVLAMCSQSWHPPPGCIMEGIDLWYELGFLVCKDEHAENGLGGLYSRLLFGNKFFVDYNKSLGVEYRGPASTRTCTFDEFWKAWERGTLLQLMQTYGLRDEASRYPNLDTFLAYPFGARRPLVFRLKEWLETEPACLPEALEAAQAYGFHENLDTRQRLVLKGLYQQLLSRGDAMELHRALRRGQVFDYMQKHVGAVEPDLAFIVSACRSDSD